MVRKVTIIGCGIMGEAFALELCQHFKVCLCDRDPEWAKELARKIGAQSKKSIVEALVDADVVILAVKPQDMTSVANAVRKKLGSKQLLVSMLTGISLKSLKEHFNHPKIVRIVPNLAIRFGKGIIGAAEDKSLTQETKTTVQTLLASMGSLYWLPEDKLDALTSLTGSGPAFSLVLIESMIDAAIHMGFSVSLAQELVVKMLEGTLSILENTDEHPGDIRWQITSPGGTTITGLKKLEESGMRAGMINTFLAAYDRAREISKGH